MTPESRIQASVMKWLRTLPETAVWKISDMNNVGFPDILGVYKGMAFFLEVKSKAGRVSDRQAYEAVKIQKAGGRVEMVRSLEMAQLFFIKWFGVEAIDKAHCTLSNVSMPMTAGKTAKGGRR